MTNSFESKVSVLIWISDSLKAFHIAAFHYYFVDILQCLLTNQSNDCKTGLKTQRGIETFNDQIC